MKDTKDSGMPEYPCNSTAKPYFDMEGNPCTLYHLVRNEPEWAENRIRHMEQQLKDSESYLQSRIAEAEERQRERCADAYRKAQNRANEVHWENTEDTYNAILNAGGQDDE